jgi:hypothetical protein
VAGYQHLTLAVWVDSAAAVAVAPVLVVLTVSQRTWYNAHFCERDECNEGAI